MTDTDTVTIPAAPRHGTLDWHTAALEARANGQRLAASMIDQPEAGFYRTTTREGVLAAVAYWYDSHDHTLRCQVDGEDQTDLRARELWPFASQHPVNEEEYVRYMLDRRWPDQSEAVINDVALAKSVIADPTSPDGLRLRIEALRTHAVTVLADGVVEGSTAPAWRAAATEAESNVGADLANRLAALVKAADAQRVAEKQPFLDRGREVDAKWNPIKALAEEYVRPIKEQVVGVWQRLENQRRREVAEAEQRRLTEAAAAAAANQGVLTNDILWRNSQPPATFKPATSGTMGRKIAQRPTVVARIYNREKFLAQVKENVLISEALQQIANAGRAARTPYDGVEYLDDTASV